MKLICYWKEHKLYFIYRTISFMISILVLLSFFGCSKSASEGSKDGEADYITKTSFALNTVCTIHLYDSKDQTILEEAFQLVNKYEKIYSMHAEDSELYQLNHGLLPHTDRTYTVSNELADILKYGLKYSKLSKGAFDITIGPVSSQWDFISEQPIVPKQENLKKGLANVGYQYIRQNENEITFLKDGVQIDLGAVAKGYIADRVKELLLTKGIKSAIINLGGNVLCIGNKMTGIPFKVGVQKPFADRNETVAVMEISDRSVVSSGVYERFFQIDDKLYHHILNPKTGFPYDNDLISVTIISKSSVDGDCLSTSCFSLGLEKGLKLIENTPDTYAVFITKDYTIHYSKGFKDAIKLS
jgi:FAD:protein FMN transferase